MTDREPIPSGRVSTIRGHYQGPALKAATVVALVAAALGLLLPDDAGTTASVTAIAIVVATPLLRVAWLAFRWTQERDWRFVAASLGLLAVVGLGAALAALDLT